MADQAGESRNQIHRYIRLTHLSRSLLNLVDEGQIALTPAVELSFLTESEQAELTEAIAYAGATPSLSQAQQMKRLSQEDNMRGVLSEQTKWKYRQFLSEHAAFIPAQQMETALNLPECTLPRPWE